jgi:N-dimethylarginine dimethylaminohydrolase
MSHRRAEVDHVKAVVQNLGVQLYAHIERGHIEGGDICILRDGLVVVGYSNERTDQLGAEAVGALFAERGWEVVYARFEPEYLHLDTIMTMVAHDCAVVLPDALENTILTKLRALGIKLIIATAQEVRRLSANFLSLGDNRVLAPQHSERLAALLGREGIEVIEVDIDQFTRCGGGPHCLTMPLARRA